MIAWNRKQHALHSRVRKQWPYFTIMEKGHGTRELRVQEKINEEFAVLFESLNNLSPTRNSIHRIRPRIRVKVGARFCVEFIKRVV